MNAFDWITWLGVLTSVVALLRSRPALLVLAGNQTVVARAFAQIATYGQPSSQFFLPADLFTSTNLSIAAWVMASFSTMLAIAVLLPTPASVVPSAKLPALPKWFFWTVVTYFLVAAIVPKSIVTAHYAGEDADGAWTIGGVNLSGFNTLLQGLFYG